MKFKRSFTWVTLAGMVVTLQIAGCSTYVTIPEAQAGRQPVVTETALPPIPTVDMDVLAETVPDLPQDQPVPEAAQDQVVPDAPQDQAISEVPQYQIITGEPADGNLAENTVVPTLEIPAAPEIPTNTVEALPTLPPAPLFTPTVNMATVAPTSKTPPLEIAFPTAIPEESRDWRPPLYPIPWALSSHDHFYFARPISANVVNWPLWNYRYGGTTPAWEGVVHTGIDIDAPMGTPVRASAPGRVLWAGYGLYNGTHDTKDPYGIAVTLQHDFGFEGEKLYTIYAHMNEVYVEPNQMVNTGDIIGIVGQTGATTGPHLHFEVRWKQNMFNSTLNPELWLAPPQGWGVLAGRVMNTSGSFYISQDVTIMRADKKQTWIVRTYGDKYVRSDPFYQENVVLSDLPEGNYIINIEYEKVTYRHNITINAGAVTYFKFKGKEGFESGLPKEASGFSPAPE